MKTSKVIFIEFAINSPENAIKKFLRLGFSLKAKHIKKNILIMEQNSLYIILNCMATDHAMIANNESGDSVCGLGILCQFNKNCSSSTELYDAIETIPFIGNCQLYFLDERFPLFENNEWIPLLNTSTVIETPYFTEFDHIAFAINQGNMEHWVAYIRKKLPDFRCLSNIVVEGNYSGMKSIAFISSSNKVRIPIVEPKGFNSQVQYFLDALKKEGVQHIAFATNNIISVVEKIKKNKIRFLKSPNNYYKSIENQLNTIHYPKVKIMQHDILVDKINKEETLYQIFTKKQIGPIFFEVVERHNYEGFGEGNYKALFISAEDNAE